MKQIGAVSTRYQTLTSHALSDYSRCFRPYTSADVLIYDPCVLTLETLRAQLSRIIVKDGLVDKNVDHGRNATVNICTNYNDLLHRLFVCKETYGLLIINDDSDCSSGIGTLVRGNGYENTMALVCDVCTINTSRKCRDIGFDVCLVRHTGTIHDEVTKLLAAVAIRCQHTYQVRMTRAIDHTKQEINKTEKRKRFVTTTW